MSTLRHSNSIGPRRISSTMQTPSSGTFSRTTYGSPAASRRAISSARVAQAEPVVARRLAGRSLRDAHLLEPFRRAEALEGVTRREQLLRILAIDARAFALTVRAVRTADVGAFVPRQPAPAQRLEDRALALGRAAGVVGILDAQHELAAVLAGETIVDQRDVRRANVRIAGRRRRDAGANASSGPTDELFAYRIRAARSR